MNKKLFLPILIIFFASFASAATLNYDSTQYQTLVEHPAYDLVATYNLLDQSLVTSFVSELYTSAGGFSMNRKVEFRYEDMSTEEHETTHAGTTYTNKTSNNPYPDRYVNRVRLYIHTNSGGNIARTVNQYVFGNITYIDINLISPDDNDFFFTDDKIFNVTLSPSQTNLTNATLYIWDENDAIFNQTTNIITGEDLNSTTWNITDFTIQQYKWGVYGCGNESDGTTHCAWADNQTLTYGLVINNQTFEDEVFDSQTTDFEINVTYDDDVVTFISATLEYDGVNYTSASTTSENDTIFTTTLPVPSVVASVNKSFRWILFISDTGISDFLATNPQNQTVSPIIFQNCTTGTVAVNYTILDEGDGTPINVDFDSTFFFQLNQTSTIIKNYSVALSGQSSYLFCINANRTYYVDADISLSATGYVTRPYRLANKEYDETTTIEYLYMINESDASNIIIEVKDAGFQPLEDYTVRISRFQEGTGEFVVVEEQVTDIFGQFMARLVENTARYKFEFYDPDGTLVKTAERTNIVCRATICILSFVIQDVGDDFRRFDDIEDHDYSLAFNNATNTFVFAWTDNTGDSGVIHRLVVWRKQLNGTAIVSGCNVTSTSLSSSLTCAVGNEKASYVAQVYRETDDVAEVRIDILSAVVGDTASTFGVEGIFWVIIAGFTVMLTALFSPVVAVVLFIVAIIAFQLAGIIYLNPIMIIALIAIGAFFAWAFKS